MIDYRAGREMAANVGETLWENSIPLALVGAGIGWFLVSGMVGSRSGGGRKQGRRGGGGGQGRGGQGGGGQGGGAGAQGAGEQQGQTQGTLSSIRERGARLTGTAGEQAQRVYRRASRTFGDMVEEQPLLLGAAGLIVGAALGAVIPGTRYESELVGETAEELTRTVREYGREQLDKAHRVVERTVDAVKEEAGRQGFSAEGAREAVDEVRNRATNVASSVAGIVREETGIAVGGKEGGSKGAGGAGGGGAGASQGGGQAGRQDANRGNDMTSGAGRPPQPATGGEANRGNDMTSQPGGQGSGGPKGTV